MIVLHATFEGGEFLLWAEATVEGDAVPPALAASSPKRGRPNKNNPVSAPAFLPFAADSQAMQAALSALGTATAATECDTVPYYAWLPTMAGQPFASSPLIAPPPEASTPAIPAPWRVPVMRLPVPSALELLCVISNGGGSNNEMLAPGILVGRDLEFWATAMKFAGALVAREQFLPGLRSDESTYRACWEPVFAGAEADRLAQLARAMPHSCRSLGRDASQPPTSHATAILTGFINTIVDHLVRASRAIPVSTPETSKVRRQPRKKASTKKSPERPAFDSLHDQWQFKLVALDGLMEGSAAELEQLSAQIHDWRRPLAVTAGAPWRLCFRLEEPIAPDAEHDADNPAPLADGDWQVRYLLQASDDPSLLVPTEAAWQPNNAVAASLRRKDFKVREYLLAALGQAAAVNPQVEGSLKTAAPGGYELDANGAHEFLVQQAWLLEQAGFGVFLPSWWTRKGTKLQLAARARAKSPKLQGGGGLSLDEIVEFQWDVALGGEKISLSELEALARLKAPLVRWRGQWVQLNSDEIQAALEFWKKRSTPRATVREIVQMALGAGDGAGPLAIEGVEAKGWLGDLLGQLNGSVPFATIPAPGGFQGELRPYQQRGYSWLNFLQRWGLGACLADDMGLGKTPQTLALVQSAWEAGERRPTLLICPTSVITNWQKEAARFTPELPVMIYHGVGRTKGAAFKKQASQQALVLSSYALLHRDSEVLKSVEWAGVVLDEAQNIKNAETKQSQAARALPAGFRIALTGTPVENNVGDLWSILDFLNPGFLGKQSEFKRRFFVPIQTGADPTAAERLQRLTGPFVLRRLKTDKSIISDLPEKNEMKVYCTLTKEQGSLYAAVVEETTAALNNATGIKRKGMVLSTLMKLKQACNHPAQLLGDNSAIPGRSGKLARLTEMLEEVLAAGDRTLVFTQFREMGDIIRRHLQETFGREVLFLHGGTTKKARDRMVERFQSDEASAPPIFLLSLKAGGVGLNLTRANHVFHFDRWWNPAVENQATDRAFRIGQMKNVQVHKFVCAGTFEEKIDEMIERKQVLASQVVGTGEGWLTELSTAELKDLFALSREAISE